jgi:hypothetical protein
MSHHPSALRNREPIAAKIAEILGPAAAATPLRALEIASGTGAHLEFFAEKFPLIKWQPSEYVPPAEDGQEYRTEEQLASVGKIGSRADATELEVCLLCGAVVIDVAAARPVAPIHLRYGVVVR